MDGYEYSFNKEKEEWAPKFVIAQISLSNIRAFKLWVCYNTFGPNVCKKLNCFMYNWMVWREVNFSVVA